MILVMLTCHWSVRFNTAATRGVALLCCVAWKSTFLEHLRTVTAAEGLDTAKLFMARYLSLQGWMEDMSERVSLSQTFACASASYGRDDRKCSCEAVEKLEPIGALVLRNLCAYLQNCGQVQ